jgi:ribonuclease HII
MSQSKNPSQNFERTLHAEGFFSIAALDEAGRGAWAGPVVAAAVVMPLKPRLRGIKDSKQLSATKREQFAQKIKATAITHALGIVDAHEIDQIGIARANILAFERAIADLTQQPDHLFIDAFSIDTIDIPQTAIIKGDQKVYSIAAASILAKVARDNMMVELHAKHPHYGFDAHKGYGTAAHRAALKQHGITKHHRKTFRPMSETI